MVTIHYTVINDDEENYYEYADCIEVEDEDVDEKIKELEKQHHNVHCE